MHITASVFINDDERGLHADYPCHLPGTDWPAADWLVLPNPIDFHADSW
jgi:hypothetical protein